jgi:predicted lipase
MYDMIDRSRITLQTYTFGCPRVGDRNFANEYDRRVPLTFRFVFDRYMSTTVPTMQHILLGSYSYHYYVG